MQLCSPIFKNVLRYCLLLFMIFNYFSVFFIISIFSQFPIIFWLQIIFGLNKRATRRSRTGCGVAVAAAVAAFGGAGASRGPGLSSNIHTASGKR